MNKVQVAREWYKFGLKLDRAGVEPLDSEYAFRRAVRYCPRSVPFHRKLITFLIEQAQYDTARDAIGVALSIIDPRGDHPSDVVELMGPVVDAWLSAGETCKARAWFNDMPKLAMDPLLPALRARLESYERQEEDEDEDILPAVYRTDTDDLDPIRHLRMWAAEEPDPPTPKGDWGGARVW